jgi:mRNA-capping enzyme
MSEYCSKFSCLCLQLPFSERWRLLEDEIIRPRYYEKKQFESGVKSNPMYKYDMELFSVRRKDFWLLSTVTKLLKEFIPSLSHDADGLIFQVGLPSIQGNGCIVIGEVRMH